MTGLLVGMLCEALRAYVTSTGLRTVLGLGDLKKSGIIGRFGGRVGGPGCLGVVELGDGAVKVVGTGGGIISLGWGSWKVRLNSAWPLSRDLR